MLQSVLSSFVEPGDKPALNRARYEALSKQIPVMYAIVIIDMLAMSYTHFSYAPVYLTLYLPAILTPVTIYRSIKIYRSRFETLNDAQVRRRLLTINILAAILGAICVGWALALFNYGDAYTKSHTAFFICLTTLGVIACLMHLRQAGIILFATVVCPTVIFLAATDQSVFHAIALNILLVSAAILFIMFRYNNDFTDMIEKQQILEQQSKILKILSTENLRLANLDSLTTIPNRRRFFSELSDRIEERKTSQETFAVGILDLDGFKQVNDVFGHPAGDQLLIDTSVRLRELLDKDEVFIARLGGDEFGLILNNPGSEREVIALGNQICDELLEPFEMKEGSAQVAGTIGFAFFPDAGDTPSVLFERADYALCYSKQNCKGTVGMFTEEHETLIREVSSIAHRLREADLSEELSVYFQPIINTVENRTFSCEALARWHNPILGNIPPNVFIRSAEQSGMVSRLTAILFKKSLDAAAEWPEHVGLSFNLSTYDLCSPESLLNLLNTIEKSNFKPERITFEITETAVMQDFMRATHGLKLIRQLGAKVALDDFGTGYSSLSYLPRMPIDRLKVDRSFIEDIESSQAKQDIMCTIAQLCDNLNLESTVEGVENETQYKILDAMGYHLIQGYYFSKPLQQDELAERLAAECETPVKKSASGRSAA